MEKNIGKQERMIRTLAGLSLVYFVFSRQKLLSLSGLSLLVTAALEYCPMNQALDLSTYELPKLDLESEGEEAPILRNSQRATNTIVGAASRS